ncbi:MAG: hypothetical protein HUJ74_01010 [Lachnospiraceae bacterium]|nr:hypothetical protein [Lachnospiraceae bacterium]
MDIFLNAVKIEMLSNCEIVHAVVECLKLYQPK